MSFAFLLTSLLWTGLLALLAEALTRGRVTPCFAQTVWRFAALLMVLPWLGLVLAPLLPGTPAILPDFPDLVELAGADDTAAILNQGETASPIAALKTSDLLLGILVLGWLTRAGFALLAQYRLTVLKQSARSLEVPGLSRICTLWSEKLQLRKSPQIATLAGHRSPFVSGLLHQTIYLPDSLTPDSLSREAHLKSIIAHECTHIARGDLITRPLERMVADLLWFSPFAWLARTRLDYYREAVCDAQTVLLTGNPVAYGRALAHVARIARPMATLPVAALILNKRKTLPMRVSSLLEPSIKTSRKHIGAGLVSLLIAAPLAIAQGLGEPGSNKVQTFSAPVINATGARVTSAYGLRTDPFTKESAWHMGADIGGVPYGSPLAAPASGKVIFAGSKPGYGDIVEIRLDASRDIVRYAHLSGLKVTDGDHVSAGDVVGLVGRSTRSTGAHLHFEYLKTNPKTSGTPDADHSEADTMLPYNPEDIEGLVLFVEE